MSGLDVAARGVLDRPGMVRPGEALDTVALLGFLRTHQLAEGEEVRVLQFPRGFSNLTYHIQCGETSCILRRPPLGVGKGVAHDVVREAKVLSALGAVYPLVPRILAVGEDPAILGAPFYLMAQASGIILRDRLPDGLTIDAVLMRRISESAVDTLAGIHAVDYVAAGLGALGTPEGYVERQVAGWSKRFAAAATDPQPELERIAAWLAATHIGQRAGALVHNDFKYDNLVLAADDPARVVAVLDWEMATIGDPGMDVGTTLAYWVEAGDAPELRSLGLGITALPGNLTREELIDRYSAATGRRLFDAVFYYVFGLFKVAVIAQQIYARYVKGVTQDARFAQLGQAVTALGVAAARVVDRNRVGA